MIVNRYVDKHSHHYLGLFLMKKGTNPRSQENPSAYLTS